MPTTSMPSASPPIQSTNKCASGARSGSIPTSSTGRRSRPPSTHCPEFGSHAGKSCDQNSRQEPIKRAAELRLRFTDYRKKTKTYRSGVDFRSYRGNVETALRNVADVNAGWVDELIGHDSPIRRSEGA